jgi:DNA anti-recombination protein RmuC
MMSTKLLLLIPCLCVGAISLRWINKDSSIKPLKAQLADLQQQLQGFDELKEEFVRHRIELSWEEQHLTEIEDQKKQLQTNIIHMAEDINERHKRKQEQIERWLSAWQDKVKGGDPEKITQQLENSLAAERIKVNEARKKNAALKGLLYDLKLLLPDEKANGT